MPPDAQGNITRVNIRPGTKILGSLRHLNYKPWYALAEFVDNALQSFLVNRDRLGLAGGDATLHVWVNIQGTLPGRIEIRDDAAGIAAMDFERAFRPAEVPPDASGLSEFGMGMKSAACWFSDRWEVTTSALCEDVARTVRFDIASIVENNTNELDVELAPAASETHYTHVVLESLHAPLAGRTLGKVKEHLRDIYRCYLRDGTMVLEVNGQPLSYQEPEVLRAPYYRDLASPPILWRKNIDVDLGGGQHARGFAALRKEGKGTEAGFALFRRKRLIQGSADEGWKHAEVFGRPNSYRHQRLFGELHLEGFEVSHTKDGFRWVDEDAFANLLADYLDEGDVPLLKQGEGHRQNAPRPVMQRSAVAAVVGTRDDMRSNLANAMPPAAEQASAPEPVQDQSLHQSAAPRLADEELSFDFRGSQWTVAVRVADDDGQGDWLMVQNAVLVPGATGGRRIEVQVSSKHPFMTRFAQREPEVMQALVRVAASLGIAEALLQSVGGPNPTAIRRTANELLKDVFSTV